MTQTTLKLLRYFEPAAPAELTTIQLQQLLAAGQRYFSQAHSAETLMGPVGAGERSFHGCLQFREIGDANGQPAYTSLYYMGDSGTIFKAGTTEVIAEIIQDGLECDDEELSEALDAVLALKPTPVAAPKQARAPTAKKKPAAKAKQAAPKKAAAKAAPKNSKKSKKPAPKKVAAKKPVKGKKPAPKKAAPKKAKAKKPAPRKVGAKAKKPAAKQKR